MEQKQNNLRSLLLLKSLPKVLPPDLSRPQPPARAPSTPAQPAPKPQSEANVAPTISSSPMGSPSLFSALIPSLMTLKGQMIQELEQQPNRLLALNASRREGIASYLDRLASQSSAPSAISGIGDAAGGLRRWVEGPRTPAQNTALRSFFEEVALIFLGQAILLKNWSDAGLRRLSESDIGKLNWAIATALKPHVPLDREPWQVTRPNLFSWYTPSPAIQQQIWLMLEHARISEEGPGLILSIAGPARQAHPEASIPQGYDARFFKAVWNVMPSLGLDLTADSGPIKRHRVGFSPTLRDGSMLRAGPSSVSWVGTESSPFQLLVAELLQLWWGPQAPPLWAYGSGLETHTRDQLQLALSSAKPSLLSRIADMEACDVAFTLEERVIRSQGRTAEAARFREQLDALPYFKKLKSGGTSLGDLQACVAVSKLRPGGMLWWGREEPLSQTDGQEALAFLLDRAKLLCEWDLSGLEHQLPVTLPLFPRYLYLFTREPNVEQRVANRPLRVSLSGQIRSHIELPVVLEDALRALTAPEKSLASRGHWQVHAQLSPISQRDWAERWPSPASQNTIQVLERLRSASVPLANVSTIRAVQESALAEYGNDSQELLVQASFEGGERKLLVSPGTPSRGAASLGSGGAFLVLLPDSSWRAPLASYLSSPTVRDWLDHHAERRGERWVLSEQVMRWIPVPNLLLAELGGGPATPFSAESQSLLAELAHSPKTARERLSRVAKDESTLALRMAVFVNSARMLSDLRTGQESLLSLVDRQGRLAWTRLLEILPKSEHVQITMHPRINISGNLPPHLPISRIERIKSPANGILLASELGMFIQLTSESTMVIDMLWEQLTGAQHPTWSELVQSLRLPRRLELAQSAAEDVLKSHAEVSMRIQCLNELLSDCSVF